MRRRLVSFFALLLCITYSITFGATSANATYNTLDKLPIDPIGDMDDFKNSFPNLKPGVIPTFPERVPEIVEPNLGDAPMSNSPMLFSMNNNDNFRTFTVRAGAIHFGNHFNDGFFTTLTEGDTLSFTSRNGTNAIMVVDDAPENQITFGRIEEGTIIDIEVPFEMSAGHVLTVSGSGSFGLQASAHEFGPIMYPDGVSILVNGTSVTAPVSLGDLGVFAFADGEYEVTKDIESVGYRFIFDEQKEGSYNKITNKSTTSYALLVTFNDQGIWEFTEAEPQYNGLLNSIIGWLGNLWDAIVSLPGTIASLLLDGLSALFLPTEEQLLELYEKYVNLMDSRLGFIYEGFSWLLSFFDSFFEELSSARDYEFVFPGISVPMNGESIVIVEETVVSMNNDVMSVLRPVCGTIVSLIAVIGAANSLFSMVAALISGTSYFEYLKRGSGDDAD